MKRIFFSLLVIVSLLIPNKLFAQAAGLNFTLGFPQGEFKDNVKRTGIGVSGNFLLLSPQNQNPLAYRDKCRVFKLWKRIAFRTF